MKRFAAVLALLMILLLIPVPPVGTVINSIGDMLHAPLFACLSLALFRLLHQRWSKSVSITAAISWILASAVAALPELLQLLTGRTPSSQDLFADICGVSIGVFVAIAVASPQRRRRVTFLLAAAIVLAIAISRPVSILIDVARQHSEFPVLGSFERTSETSRWTAKESQIQRVSEHATSGNWSLQVDLHPGIYPGTSLPHLPADWSEFDELTTDIWLDGSEPLRIVVKVTDRSHNNEHEDRFQRGFVLKPGANHLRIPLGDIQNAPLHRQLELQRVATLSYFTVRLASPRTLFLDNVYLR